jgi:hypothetical protein
MVLYRFSDQILHHFNCTNYQTVTNATNGSGCQMKLTGDKN